MADLHHSVSEDSLSAPSQSIDGFIKHIDCPSGERQANPDTELPPTSGQVSPGRSSAFPAAPTKFVEMGCRIGQESCGESPLFGSGDCLLIPTLRLLPQSMADGPWNMAADEVLLENAARLGIASLRFYTWSQPTLSLGYFQPAAVRAELAGLDSLAWVRRSTGGAAIIHDQELTYALALPPGRDWHSVESWICRFHHLVAEVLTAVGLRAHVVVCGEEKKLGEVLCFLHQTPGDLLIAGSKVAGSAQRKWKGAILQHGSLLLRASNLAPMLPGMNECSPDVALTSGELANRLIERLRPATGWNIENADWSDEDQHRIQAIRAEKYADPGWNEKR